MKKSKTLEDVALVAGVSKMTASRALRGDKDVSQVNITKVRNAARKIGYLGNPLAASLSGKGADLIGVVVPNLENIVFAKVLSGINETLSATNLQSVFGVTDYSTDKEFDVIRGMLSWRPTGMIVTGMDLATDTKVLLSESDVPIVQIMDSDGEAIDGCVGFSHFAAGQAMAAALIRSGRKSFGYVGCNLNSDLRAARRRAGFIHELEQSGLEFVDEVFAEELSSVKKGRQLTEKLFQRNRTFDCVYFSNDDMAFGGLFCLLDHKLRVPEDIALAGFNGLDLLSAVPGKIATSRTNLKEIGIQAAKQILDSLNNRKAAGGRLTLLEPKVDLGLLNQNL